MKRIIATVLIVTALVFLVGCGTSNVAEETVSREYGTLINIGGRVNSHGHRQLVYDEETQIVYYYSISASGMRIDSVSMCPYYSANGYLCRYNPATQQIEEIIH